MKIWPIYFAGVLVVVILKGCDAWTEERIRQTGHTREEVLKYLANYIEKHKEYKNLNHYIEDPKIRFEHAVYKRFGVEAYQRWKINSNK